MNTQIKYRTFDELMDEVRLDFFTYEMEGMIEPSQLIKVAQKVNYDLGLRIYTEKQKVLEIVNGKVKLPDDFYILTMALLCADYRVREEVLQGTHTEDVYMNVCTTCNQPTDNCGCESVVTVCENKYVKVMHKKNYVTKEYTEFKRLYVRPAKAVDPVCSQKPDYHNWMEAELRNGFLYIIGIETGTVYLNYLGNLEDEHGNLQVNFSATNVLNIDTHNPQVISVNANAEVISDQLDGDNFMLDFDFDDSMDMTVVPGITFSGGDPLANTLTLDIMASEWIDSDTYIQSCLFHRRRK